MARKAGLGKGLGALIPGGENEEPQQVGGAIEISTDNIIPNPHQPRQLHNDEELAELAASIREHGILQPLIVSKEDFSQQYTLIAGERRLRAARLAGLQNVPVLIRQATEQQQLELALIENVQRSDLMPLETAAAYQELADSFALSHEEIATRVGKSRVSVTNTIRLLKLPDTVKAALAEGKISEGHACALLALNSPQSQIAALNTILKNNFSVRQTEELVRNLSGTKTPRPTKQAGSPEIKAIEEKLRSVLGTKVTLRHGKKGGSLVIHYYSDEELETLLDQIMKG